MKDPDTVVISKALQLNFYHALFAVLPFDWGFHHSVWHVSVTVWEAANMEEVRTEKEGWVILRDGKMFLTYSFWF